MEGILHKGNPTTQLKGHGVAYQEDWHKNRQQDEQWIKREAMHRSINERLTIGSDAPEVVREVQQALDELHKAIEWLTTAVNDINLRTRDIQCIGPECIGEDKANGLGPSAPLAQGIMQAAKMVENQAAELAAIDRRIQL